MKENALYGTKKYDVVWAFESHNFQSFERGVTKQNTCLFARLWLGRIPKNRNIIENVQNKKAKEIMYVYSLLGKFKWLATVELSPEYHLWQEALHISLLNEMYV